MIAHVLEVAFLSSPFLRVRVRDLGRLSFPESQGPSVTSLGSSAHHEADC
jgi:hypothetical protein